MEKQNIYFPNLNGIRCIAAFLVIVNHIEQIKSISGLNNYIGVIPFIGIIGKLGVILFFVLSGFLITYLLLAEEHSFHTISIKKFYIRRILRIWPLYFLIITLAFLVLPNISLFTLPGFGKEVIYRDLLMKLFLYAVFFPNLALSMLGMVSYATHTWSIGTEEQFYLVWPVILKHFKKHRILLMFLIILFYLSVARFLGSNQTYNIPFKKTILGFWLSFNIDCMAIGGIFAIIYFQKNKLLAFLLNKYLFYFSLVLVIVFMILGVDNPFVYYEFYSMLFGIIILNFAVNGTIKISLENKSLKYLGKISYGLYMYHPIAIVLALAFASKVNLITNWLVYPISFILTIIMAGLSYRYYETYFLNFKRRFSFIISGKSPKESLSVE